MQDSAVASERVAKRDLKRRELILNGNLIKAIVVLASPLILLNLLSYIYGIIDMVVIAGRGSTAVTSVVMVTQLKSLLSTLGAGLATGSTIIVSRRIGRNDYDGARTCAGTYLCVSAGVAVVVTALSVVFATPILKAAGFNDRLLQEGRSYFIVQLFTVGISIWNSTFMGLEKSRGAVNNVLFVNVAVMIVKVALSLLFVQKFDLEPVWVAASTLFANLIVTGYGIVRLLQKNYLFRFSFRRVAFKKGIIAPYLKLAFPAFLGSFVFNLGKVIVNRLGTRYGDSATGALGISNNVAGSITTLTSATEDAYGLIVSQNLGAGNIGRIVKTFWISVVINVAIGIVGTVALQFISDWLIWLLAKSNGDYSAEYAALIKSIFTLEMYGIAFLGLNSACMGFIYGLGYTKLSLVFNLTRLLVLRLPVVMIMAYRFPEYGAMSLGLGMMISNIGVGIVSFIIALVCLAVIKKKGIADRL